MSTELPPMLDPAVIADAMSNILRTQVTEVRPLDAAVGGQNVRIDTPAGAYTVKIAERSIIATETWACAWANEHGVLAPEVVTTDLTETTLARPFALLRWREGTEATPQDHAVVEAGRQLATLHATSIEGYGSVHVAPDGTARGEFDTWEHYVDAIINKRADLTANLILGRADSNAAHRALRAAHTGLAYERPGSVLHFDLRLRHILVSDGQLSGILDWADSSVGDPVMDFAILSRDGDDTLASVMRGYGIEMSATVARKIVAYRMLSTIDNLWFEWHTGGDWFDAYRRSIVADTQLLESLT